MRVAAIVESRMGSRRLPGKTLRPLLGRPMVCRLIERVRRAALVDVVCLATSVDPSPAIADPWRMSWVAPWGPPGRCRRI